MVSCVHVQEECHESKYAISLLLSFPFSLFLITFLFIHFISFNSFFKSWTVETNYRRKKTVEEILSTEKSYLTCLLELISVCISNPDLDSIMSDQEFDSYTFSFFFCVTCVSCASFLSQIFLRPIRKEKYLDEEEIMKVFSNIEPIHDFQYVFSEELEARIKTWSSFGKISDLFIKFVRRYFHLFVSNRCVEWIRFSSSSSSSLFSSCFADFFSLFIAPHLVTIHEDVFWIC